VGVRCVDGVAGREETVYAEGKGVEVSPLFGLVP
jgi:hypothetical protein